MNPTFSDIKYFFSAFALLSLLLFACKKEDNTINEVRLHTLVQDDLGNNVSGAKIYIFDNRIAYENALGSGSYSTAIDSVVSTASGVPLILEGNKEHWILVQYYDAGRNYILKNIGDGRIEKLEKNSELDIKIFIAPISGHIAFWSGSANAFPINVTFNNVPQTPLTNAVPVAPAGPGNTSALNIVADIGTYTYHATADNGCVWTGTVTVTRGGFHPIEFTPCVRGRVSFAAPSYDPIHGPISVSLDNNDFIGTLNGTGSYMCGAGAGTGSASGSVISVTRDLNNYTYVAKTQDGACTWTGSFSLTADACININLPTCP